MGAAADHKKALAASAEELELASMADALMNSIEQG